MGERKVKGAPVKVCPRCGEPYSYIERRKVGSQVYLYAVHVHREGRKRRVRKCYLGPEGAYIYVTKTHAREGLALKGLADNERALEYLDALISHISNMRLYPRASLSLGSRLIQLGLELSRMAYRDPDLDSETALKHGIELARVGRGITALGHDLIRRGRGPSSVQNL